MVGPGRWSDDERLPLESVTQALLLSAPCPVLAIPRHPRNPALIESVAFARVLCAVDFSAASTQALRYATAIAAQFRSRLQVLHVLDLTSQAREAGVLALGDGNSWRDLEMAALRHLHAAVPDDVRSVTTVEEVIGVGLPAREILHAAREMNADVIVMGAQSRAGFELLRFGSAAHGVVRDALCPVPADSRGSHPTCRTGIGEAGRARSECCSRPGARPGIAMRAMPVVAYFSMEIALDPAMPIYSGGLGVLAGDTLRSAADLSMPLVGVTLLHRKGYFYQRLDGSGRQIEEAVAWVPQDSLTELPACTTVTIEGRAVQVRAWRYDVKGVSGFRVPVYLLDTDLADNSDWDRTSPIFSTVATRTTGSVRRSSWAWAVSTCCARSATPTSSCFT